MNRIRLVASLIVRDELGRYLEPCLDHLLEFCDAVAVLDDGSDDLTREYLARRAHDDDRIRVRTTGSSTFFDHEGRARQALLEWTAKADPTHVLAIDADEFVSDGAELRRRLAAGTTGRVRSWTLEMREVWEIDGDCLCVRDDGGWRRHPVSCVWRFPASYGPSWQILDRQLACGRIPTLASVGGSNAIGGAILHFGWACRDDRKARYDRYAVHDGGRFHRSAHLESILWPESRVVLAGEPWPAGLGPVRDRLVERAGRTLPPVAHVPDANDIRPGGSL